VEPVTLPSGGAATPHHPPFPRRAALSVVAIAVAALLAFLVLYAYRQTGFLIDFVNLRLC
jgi:hypothetical protein